MNVAKLDITWDSAKSLSNIVKHGVTFAQAAAVLKDPLALTVFDSAHNEVEERWFSLGMADGKLLAVSHTYRATGPVSAQVRIISARPSTRSEREQYENEPQ